MKYVVFLSVWFFLVSCGSPENDQQLLSLAQLQLESSTVVISEVVSDLTEPWDITWGPDGHIWFTEHTGHVSRLDPSTGVRKVLCKVADVHYIGSRGLLSMALHPNFEEEPWVYVHYTYKIDSTKPESNNVASRLARYRYDATQDTLIAPEVIFPAIPGTTYHNGSRMIVTPDQKILLSTGDAGNTKGSQDPMLLSGKILRMNLDGSIPDDNPTEGSYVYSIGHRNAQGLVSANGMIYSSEHGPNNDDEINLILPGRNYGWPNVEGWCDKPNEKENCVELDVVEPLLAWTPTIATAGLDYYNHDAIPEWKNNLLLVALKGRSFRALQLNDAGDAIVEERIYFQKQFGRIRDVAVAPNGDIFLATSNTDWHPKSQTWMYDELPTEGYDKILRLSTQSVPVEGLPVLRQDSAQMSLYAENWNQKLDGNDPGTKLYLQNCATCHRPDGKGTDLVPPLEQSEWVKDSERLIQLTLAGLSGEIEVKGQMYNQEMPGFASLSDAEIAEVLSFVRQNFGNSFSDISAQHVAEQREE